MGDTVHEMSTTIGALAKAMAEAQAKFTVAGKDKTATVEMRNGGEYSYAYADLEVVMDACRPHLTAYGIAVFQSASASGPLVTVSTMLAHTSGEWIRSVLTMQARDGSPQAIGSAITYARRYGLSSLAGVVAAKEDDDGKEASRDWQADQRRNDIEQQQSRATPEQEEALLAEIGLAKSKPDLEKLLLEVRKVAGSDPAHKVRTAFGVAWKKIVPATPASKSTEAA